MPVRIVVDGACDFCREWAAKKDIKAPDGKRIGVRCDDCGQPIPVYPGMGGSGYESATTHHFHSGAINGIPTDLGVKRELCRACYDVDYAKQFPGFSHGLPAEV